jgi:hypothetical protein
MASGGQDTLLMEQHYFTSVTGKRTLAFLDQFSL